MYNELANNPLVENGFILVLIAIVALVWLLSPSALWARGRRLWERIRHLLRPRTK